MATKVAQISLETINSLYPSDHWLRIYTDGSRIKGETGVGIFSELFLHYFVLNSDATVFKAELFAINEPPRQIMRPWLNTNIVILVDSKSALQTIANNNTPKSCLIQSIQSKYKIVKRPPNPLHSSGSYYTEV